MVIAECNTERCILQAWHCNTIWEDILVDNQKSTKGHKLWRTRKLKLHILEVQSYTLRSQEFLIEGEIGEKEDS